MTPLLLGLLGLLVPQDPERLDVTGPTPGLLRLGSTAVLELKLVNAESRPAPLRLPSVPGLELVGGRNWDERSSLTVVGSRVQRELSFSTRIRMTPSREGEFTIPAFEVSAGNRRHRVEASSIEVVKDLAGQERSFLRVTLSAEQVYINEPLRVLIDYGVDDRLRLEQGRTRGGTAYYAVELQAPWLDDMEGTVTMESSTEPEVPLNLVLNGRLLTVEYEKDYRHRGLEFNRFLLSKSFMPTRAGSIELLPVTLKFESELGQTRTDFFGRRIGGELQKFFNYSPPLTVEVLPLPEEGKPVDFYDAVGRFEISAGVDKRQVRVGNSLKLILRITGSGNTEFLEVPKLDSLAGFHLLGSRVDRKTDEVLVEYDLTPLKESSTILPAVEWNYFDTSPDRREYVNLSTQPIEISVLPIEEGRTLASLPGEEAKPVVPGVDDIFDIKLRADQPLTRAAPADRSVVMALLFAPWLCFALLSLWVAGRRRRAGDVLGVRAKGALRTFRRLMADSAEPADALIAYLAARLGLPEAAVIGPDLAERLQSAGLDADLAKEVATATEQGVAARYGGESKLDASGAEALVQRLEQVQVERSQVSRIVRTLFFACSFALTATAQELETDTRAVGEAAYRRGEYAQAESAFAAALRSPEADERMAYNLGNALYRQGKLAESLAAYERARLSMPRDRELLANIALVRRQLDLGTAEGEPFLQALADLRDSFTRTELLWVCVATNLLAALLLVFGRSYLRWLGTLVLLHALLLIIELLVLAPMRPPTGIVLPDRASVFAEPRESADLQAVLTLRAGVQVEVLAEGPVWSKVRVGDRSGYLRASEIQVISQG
ncbi:MAG: BatD family protein [Planctomycetota bacterium]|jgi:tetratricopeptide (TPR) repeat protein